MSAFSQAIVNELDDAALDLLASLLLPRLMARLETTSNTTEWIGVDQAARHLACPKSRLYSLVSARRIPFNKDGSRVLFRRNELDEWVRAGGATRP
jgi:excisionase family DNA binding protein